MLPLIGGALIGAGGGILGSALGGLFGSSAQASANATNLQIARETNKANRELAEYSYSKDLEQWHRQNQYNLPVNQMQRYSDAGLNPNLIYGQGNNGNASSSPSYNLPTMRGTTVAPVNSFANSIRGMFGELGNMVSTYNNLRIQESEINKNNAQENYFNQQAKLISTRNIGEALRNTYNEGYLPMLFQHQKALFPFVRTSEYWRGAGLGQAYQNAIIDGSIKEEELLDKQRRNAEWNNVFLPLIRAQEENWRKRNRALDDTHKLFDDRKALLKAQGFDLQQRSGINYLDFLKYIYFGDKNIPWNPFVGSVKSTASDGFVRFLRKQKVKVPYMDVDSIPIYSDSPFTF